MTAPDPLTRAFNEAVKPYMEKIERLQAEIEDKNLDIQQLEDERADMHAWIDKRGLRAGNYPLVPSILQSTQVANDTFSQMCLLPSPQL